VFHPINRFMQMLCKCALVIMSVYSSMLVHSVKVDDEVWIELIRRKYHGRYHNCNDPLRVLLGLDPSLNDPVKNYSDEGDRIDSKTREPIF
jgi:hypothetical protein